MSHLIGLLTHIAVANMDVFIVLLGPHTLTLGYRPDSISRPKYYTNPKLFDFLNVDYGSQTTGAAP
jgi:hypothetical protein